MTLDLAGHTVTGTWSGKSGVIVGPGGLSIGILIGPKAVGAKVESTLPGAAVTDFVIGIQDNADHAVITGPYLLVDGNVRGGVFVHDATSSVVKQLSLSGNGSAGLHLQRSGSVVLRANIVEGSQIYGIWDEASKGAQIMNNVVEISRTAGIYLGCSNSANLQDVGSAAPSDGSKIEHNDLLDNGEYGIAISDQSLDNYVYANNVAGDQLYDLQDENDGCDGGVTPPGNSWLDNTGRPNQTGSPSCIS